MLSTPDPAPADPVRVQLDESAKDCDHTAHVGTCPACQRAQLAKWRAQRAQGNN